MTIKIPGTNVKRPSEKAPDFVLFKIGFEKEKFLNFILNHSAPGGWINLEMNDGQYGPYLREEWQKPDQPENNQPKDDEDKSDDIPF
tara:strand:+ start:1175 stop:1435 length:261 start_codon:yes stop_codon:yes gene_type:complete